MLICGFSGFCVLYGFSGFDEEACVCGDMGQNPGRFAGLGEFLIWVFSLGFDYFRCFVLVFLVA